MVRGAAVSWRALGLSLLLSACGGQVEAGGGPPPHGSGGNAAGGASATGGVSAGIGGTPASSCTLAPIASGTLIETVGAAASLSGPGAVATDNGFMIGYRAQSGDSLRAHLTALSDSGTLDPDNILELGGCSSKVPKDGVGMAYASGHGLFVASLPDCGIGAGAAFIPFDSYGNVKTSSSPRNMAFSDLTLSQNPIAPAANPDEFDFVYRVVSTGLTPLVERVVLQGAGFKSMLPVHPFGEQDLPFAMVVSSPEVRALMAPVPLDGTMRVEVGPNAGDVVNTMGVFSLPLASWGAISAWGNHVAAAVPASIGIALGSAALEGQGIGIDFIDLIGQQPVLAGAITSLGDDLLVMLGAAGSFSVYRIPGAASTPYPTSAEHADFNPSNLPVLNAAFDGTHIALAAARDRVLVVWLTSGSVPAQSERGGWALLSCAQ